MNELKSQNSILEQTIDFNFSFLIKNIKLL